MFSTVYSWHRIPHIAILYAFIGTIQQVRHLGRGEVNEECNKSDTERRVFNQKNDVPLTNSSMYLFQ